jgi:hypothetical protein
MSTPKKAPAVAPGTRASPTRRALPGALSAKGCEAARCPPDKSELMLHDGAGLYLRVRKNGRKSWVLLYGTREDRARATCPTAFADLSLAKAREWAEDERRRHRMNAGDPQQRAREERAMVTAARTLTLEGMCQVVWEDMRERGQPSWVNFRSMFTHLPAWARAMQPMHVTHEHVERMLADVRKATPGTGVVKLFKTCLSAAFTRAKSARANLNPKTQNTALAVFNVRTNPAKDHDLGIVWGAGKPPLTRAQAQWFLHELGTEVADDRRDLLALTLLLGGQRSAQLASATIAVHEQTRAARACCCKTASRSATSPARMCCRCTARRWS